MTDEFFAGELDELAHDLGKALDRIGQLLEHRPGDEMLMEDWRELEKVQLGSSWRAERLRTREEVA